MKENYDLNHWPARRPVRKIISIFIFIVVKLHDYDIIMVITLLLKLKLKKGKSCGGPVLFFWVLLVHNYYFLGGPTLKT